MTVTPIRSGRLTGKQANLPRDAAGYYKLGGGIRRPKAAGTAILDGVVLIQLE